MSSSDSANAAAIVEQTTVEHETLAHISDALKNVIGWHVGEGDELSRKISVVRFVAQSFQRYLERLFALEEHDGYMTTVLEHRVEWSDKVESLKCQHDEFRASIRRITVRLDRITPDDLSEFEQLCSGLLDLNVRVDRHNTKETNLLSDVFLQDDGVGD